MLKADELDDFFKNEYACEMSLESKNLDNEVIKMVKYEAAANEESANNTQTHSEGNIIEKLKKLKELFEMELINEAEYHEKKMVLLEML